MFNNIEFSLEYIIEEYSGYVYKVVDNVVKDTLTYQDKEEIVSDTFYLLWKNQNNIDKNLKAYLSTIARNRAYDKLRSYKVQVDYESIKEEGYEVMYDDILTIKEKLQLLSNEEKVLFELYYLKGYKVKEISKILGKNLSNIKIRLFRIRKKLRREIDGKN